MSIGLVEFNRRAIREARRKLGIPEGWWGTWRDVTDGTHRVRWDGRAWVVSAYTVAVKADPISKHDSRGYAISKARALSKTHEAAARAESPIHAMVEGNRS